MIKALLEAGIRPDVVAGTSIGAINGAQIAADPTLAVVDTLLHAWTSPEANAVYGDSLVAQLAPAREDQDAPQLARAAAPHPRARRSARTPGSKISRCRCGWSRRASSAPPSTSSTPGRSSPRSSRRRRCPGCCRPTRIGDEHFIDGGVVNSIPIDQALAAGARTIFVLQVGRVETPLVAPTIGGRRRAGRVRDRPPAPVRARPRDASRRRRAARPAERRRARRRRRADGIPQDGDRAPAHRPGLRGEPRRSFATACLRAAHGRREPTARSTDASAAEVGAADRHRTARRRRSGCSRSRVTPLALAASSSRSSRSCPGTFRTAARDVARIRLPACGTPLLAHRAVRAVDRVGVRLEAARARLRARALPARGASRCGCCSGSSARRCA